MGAALYKHPSQIGGGPQNLEATRFFLVPQLRSVTVGQKFALRYGPER